MGFETPGQYQEFLLNMVNINFIKTMGMKLIAGRDFSSEFPNDLTDAVIVNEKFIKHFKIDLPLTGKMPGNFVNNKIIGVVKDFNLNPCTRK